MKTTRTSRYPPAPEHLSAKSQSIWIEIGPWKADTVGRRAMFLAALESLDRAAECARLLTEQGLTLTSKAGLVHVNGLAALEIKYKSQFARMWETLRIPADPDWPEYE